MAQVKEAIKRHVDSYCEILLGLAADDPLDLELLEDAKQAYIAMYKKQNIEHYPINIIKPKKPKKLFIGRDSKFCELHPFYNSSFVVGEGDQAIEWMTVEHYFQGMKFNESDPSHMISIRKAQNAAIAHRRGINATHRKQRSSWAKEKEEVLRDANFMKFRQNEDERKILFDTGNSILLLKNVVDKWLGDPGDGSGENKFGLILMEVREELRKEFPPKKNNNNNEIEDFKDNNEIGDSKENDEKTN